MNESAQTAFARGAPQVRRERRGHKGSVSALQHARELSARRGENVHFVSGARSCSGMDVRSDLLTPPPGAKQSPCFRAQAPHVAVRVICGMGSSEEASVRLSIDYRYRASRFGGLTHSKERGVIIPAHRRVTGGIRALPAHSSRARK